jgi:formylglycine-generating enzyme required for sulfatase activity
LARIYLSSTFEDLKLHREAAYRALRRLGHDVVAMEDYVASDERPAHKCLADVAACEVYVGVIGWRYGYVPADDNPNKRSITELEYRHAVGLGKPRLLFMVADDAAWPPRFVDRGDEAAGRLKGLRDELGTGRLASFFASKEQLAELVAVAVVQWERQRSGIQSGAGDPRAFDAGLGSARLHGRELQRGYPDAPYPLLQPYDHPATFGGRDRELSELERRVRAPQLVLSLHAPSGAGKSSLLRAGIVPRLRRLDYPVVLDWHPGEPGLARRIVSGLFAGGAGFDLRDEDVGAFAHWMVAARAQANGTPSVIIVDQLDDALRLTDGGSAALARLGPLMAATAQHFDGRHGYPCRWVLCYRHEFHGFVDKWLEDVLRQARAAGRAGLETLPYNLSEPDRFHSWVLPVMGTPPPGGAMGDESAAGAFLDAIERPLRLPPGPTGAPVYPVRFEGKGTKCLADAFARARRRDAEAPLVPELQVVLAHLLDGAQAGPDGVSLIRAPDRAEALDRQIDEALSVHLRRALQDAFPLEASKGGVGEARARALLALRELADAKGRRGAGLTRQRLAEAIGSDGDRIIGLLASSKLRLIVQEREGDTYTLSHDRMAEVVTRFVEQEDVRKLLAADDRVIELRRFVERRSELWASKDKLALPLDRQQYQRIEASQRALLWKPEHERWWGECVRYRTRRTWQWQLVSGLAAIVLAVGGWLGWLAYENTQNVLACGDARFSRTMWCLPDESLLGFVEIPAGPFLMGSDKEKDPNADFDELWPGTPNGQETLPLDDFYISRFEVTVAQFRRFVDETSHEPRYPAAVDAPRNYPIVNVTWHDAVAFAGWLEEKLKEKGPNTLRARLNGAGRGTVVRWRVRLPSEAEWEKAARGTEGRVYPWGDAGDPTRESSQGVVPVGSRPCPKCSFELADMSENAWEWTRSPWKNYPFDPSFDTDDSDLRVVRGGSLLAAGTNVRAADRQMFDAGGWHYQLGFRVVVSRF